jgi:uncharacterized protein
VDNSIAIIKKRLYFIAIKLITMEQLSFSVSQLLHEGTGKTIQFDFSVSPETESFPDLKFTGLLSGQVVVMRIDNGVNVSIEKLNATLLFDCQRCLESFEKEIEIEEIERMFFEKNEENEDPNENFLIDLKSQKINISEMLRQEIILHFPPVSVCSKSCKGLCSLCGCNLNQEKCECKASEDLKPLSILKELYNGKTSGTQTEDL